MNILKQQIPLTSILIKPSGPDCNLGCIYCFYLEKADLFSETKKHRMSESVLEEMIKQAMQQTDSHITFAWQGGEPTLMGLPFFEKAVAFQKQYAGNHTFSNSLQTNGILIDDKWAEFLRINNFLVGLSLDGSQQIHDKYRVMKGGKGSWKKVEESAKQLLNAGVEVNVLTVLNEHSAQFPEEIYNYHKLLNFEFLQFIPCLETEPIDKTKLAAHSVTVEQYGNFLIKIFDLWLADIEGTKATISVRFFDSVFHHYVGYPAPQCTLMEECGVYVVVEHNGDVFACDFYVEPKWKLGNVQTHKLTDMLNSDRQKEFGALKAVLPETCLSCKWLPQCRGGCPKDRVVNPVDNQLNYFCESFKMFFEHADAPLRALAGTWKKERAAERSAEVRKIAVSHNIGRNDPCPCGSGNKFKKCCM